MLAEWTSIKLAVMLTQIATTHRSLRNHLFYPIVLSSLLAFGIYAGRVFLSSNWIIYRNLVWNLFLAWIPYLLSLLVVWIFHRSRRQWLLLSVLGFIWLIFFPNAPYLLTDFLHLQERPSVPLWYDILLLATFAWTGLFLGIASLRIMQGVVKSYVGRWLGWMFVLIALAASGLGVYLGRFSRWNSWDMLTQPKLILAEVVSKTTDPLNNLRFLGFTVLFISFLTVSYLMFISMHHVDVRDVQE
ncbi:MAG: DUF1361 domain-containing protein [Anaerolineales bacterium]